MSASWDDVDELLTELRALGRVQGQGPLSVDVDASKVNAPGVWVRINGFSRLRLSGMTYLLTLYLVAPETEHRRAFDLLAKLYDKVDPLLQQLGGADGTARTVTVALPDGTRLPGLAIDVELDTTI
jgi:hypothetical protein